MILEHRKIIGGLLYYMQSLVDATNALDYDAFGDVAAAKKYFLEYKDKIRELILDEGNNDA